MAFPQELELLKAICQSCANVWRIKGMYTIDAEVTVWALEYTNSLLIKFV